MNLVVKNKLSKKKHKHYESNSKNNSKLKINVYIAIICLLLFGFSMWVLENKFESHIVLLQKNQSLLHVVSDKFLSFGLDSSLLRNMTNLPVKQKQFINLARYLSPAYVRIGGTAADCLYFQESETLIKVHDKYDVSKSPVDGQDISNFTITSEDFFSLYEFSKKADIRMIFDLNILLRNSNGTWNSDNAKKIIFFAKGHGMELDWQMGNEPNSFFYVFNIEITAEQLAGDYCKLRNLLDELGYQESILVGPEVNHIGDENHRGAVYAEKFLSTVNNCIDDVTWHQYYLNGHVAQVEDFIDSTVFNRLPIEINTMSEAINSSGQNFSMWLSETSSAYGGGAPELSDRFVAGFLWLDKLGYSAKAGVQVVIRQSLFGGIYAMVGPNLDPNPDWWVAVIFKKFVSRKVLNLATPDNFGNVRLYAHCASRQTLRIKASGIIIYGINLNMNPKKIYIQGPPQGSKIFSYILTSDHLQSRNIFMNGEILKLKSDGSLPPFKPQVLEANQIIVLPPYSMVFLLLNGMEIPACFEQ